MTVRERATLKDGKGLRENISDDGSFLTDSDDLAAEADPENDSRLRGAKDTYTRHLVYLT
jgi:hypothetical protein